MLLKNYTLASHLPLFAHTQSIEAMAKDMSMCKTIGRDERTIATTSSMKSIFCTLTKEITEADGVFNQRKRKSVDANPCYAGKTHDKNIIYMARNFFPTEMDKVEINHFRSLLSKDNHFKIDCNNELVNLVTTSQSKSRPDDSKTKVTGVNIALLLVSKI